MFEKSARWVLAFDASCGTCREMSRAVAQACEGRLEVMPLAHPDVREWRAQSLGTGAAWQPTLIRVHTDGVRAWTGPALGLALMVNLGPRLTVRALKALGRQRASVAGRTGKSRRQWRFSPIGLGLVAAAGSLMMMKPPPRNGDPGGGEDPRSWVEANRDALPQTYDAFVGHSLAYRSAIFAELSPAVRSQLWVDQFTRYRNAHPQLSADQATALDRATEFVSNESTFDADPEDRAELDQEIAEHQELAVAAFGRAEAADLFARLGPADDSLNQIRKIECVCHWRDDEFCPSGQVCQQTNCKFRPSGCGWWYAQPCDGLCTT